jgi:hypothetical protein
MHAAMPRTSRLVAAILAASVALTVPGCQSPRSADAVDSWPARLDDATLWAMVRSFSEPAGEFTPTGGYQSDNLVSNERSLQRVMPSLLGARRSGAYIGVGPEQNFTYIAALEPSIAFVIDIRRENQLLHLMYKALAEMSTDRADFLARLFARPRPAGLDQDATVQAIFAAFEAVTWSATLAQSTLEDMLERLTTTHRFLLSRDERAGVTALYARFVRGGPSMRWDSGGAWIPSYAELMADADDEGVPRSYLASESAFQTFRRYQLRNRIVPLVGDFGGTRTLAAVARYLSTHETVVAVFYTSNVEPYLRGDAEAQFVRNVAAFPRGPGSIFVRTVFRHAGFTGGRPDYRTSTLIEPMQDFVDRLASSGAGRGR